MSKNNSMNNLKEMGRGSPRLHPEYQNNNTSSVNEMTRGQTDLGFNDRMENAF